MGKHHPFLRSEVRAAAATIANNPRSLNGMSSDNIISKQRARRRARAYVPGDLCRIEKLLFDDGSIRNVLEPGGQYKRKANIPYTGTRNGDFALANNACGLAATPAGYVWHHYHDYQSITVGGVLMAGRGTLYLMSVQDHQTAHNGGCEQYRQVHGDGYA